uniref:Uncharacterized protein n=1 Tax=Dunaliella viridis TaxID=140095 RepID=A7U4W1_9CHLO|nr:hypothetical protein [Dunaliella viridis]
MRRAVHTTKPASQCAASPRSLSLRHPRFPSVLPPSHRHSLIKVPRDLAVCSSSEEPQQQPSSSTPPASASTATSEPAGLDVDSVTAKKQAEAERLKAAEQFVVVGGDNGTCKSCGYGYNANVGDPDFPVARGTKFQLCFWKLTTTTQTRKSLHFFDSVHSCTKMTTLLVIMKKKAIPWMDVAEEEEEEEEEGVQQQEGSSSGAPAPPLEDSNDEEQAQNGQAQEDPHGSMPAHISACRPSHVFAHVRGGQMFEGNADADLYICVFCARAAQEQKLLQAASREYSVRVQAPSCSAHSFFKTIQTLISISSQSGTFRNALTSVALRQLQMRHAQRAYAADLPQDYVCPVCSAPKSQFESDARVLAGFAENQKYGLGFNSVTGNQKLLVIYGALALLFLLLIGGYALDTDFDSKHWEVHLIDFKYCEDTRPETQQENAAGQEEQAYCFCFRAHRLDRGLTLNVESVHWQDSDVKCDCGCNEVQDEKHVLFYCRHPAVCSLRDKYFNLFEGRALGYTFRSTASGKPICGASSSDSGLADA